MQAVHQKQLAAPAYLQDDIFGRAPFAELACELHANDLRALQLPGQASHHIHSVSTCTETQANTLSACT